MPLVIGQSRVPDPPARMIPRMSLTRLSRSATRSTPAPLPRSAAARMRRPRPAPARRCPSARAGARRPRPGTRAPIVGVERVDAVLARRVVDVGDEVAHGRVVGQRDEAVAEPLGEVDRAAVDVVEQHAVPLAEGRRADADVDRRSRARRRAAPSRTWPGSAGCRRSGCRARPAPRDRGVAPASGRAECPTASSSRSKRYHSRNSPRSSANCFGVIS